MPVVVVPVVAVVVTPVVVVPVDVVVVPPVVVVPVVVVPGVPLVVVVSEKQIFILIEICSLVEVLMTALKMHIFGRVTDKYEGVNAFY